MESKTLVFSNDAMDARITIDDDGKILTASKVEVRSKNGYNRSAFLIGSIAIDGEYVAAMELSSTAGCSVWFSGQYSGGGSNWGSAFKVTGFETGKESVNVTIAIRVSPANGSPYASISGSQLLQLDRGVTVYIGQRKSRMLIFSNGNWKRVVKMLK